MRGARFWRQDRDSKLKKCSEFIADACDPVPTDECCAVIPCTYCLIWSVYGEDDQFGSASFDTDGWYGTIAGAAFRGYWERNYETDECEFVVTLDDVEIYRNDCYGGVTCRDSSDEAEATIGYDEGTLQWAKLEPRPLEYVTDEVTYCREHFCSDCECSCECLCVTITLPNTQVFRGEICDVAYPCDGPVWEGTVGDYTLSLALEQDMYGECIIVPTVNGYELDAVAADGCGAMSATITLDDGTLIEVRCKRCDCEDTGNCPCCPGWPMIASANVDWVTTVAVTNDCESAPSPVEVSSDFSCTDTGDPIGTLLRTAATELWVRVYCHPDTLEWKVQYRSATSGGGFEPPASTTWTDATAVEFVCPDCADAIDGQASGTIDFIAEMACEISGPTVVPYSVLVHGEVTIGCP